MVWCFRRIWIGELELVTVALCCRVMVASTHTHSVCGPHYANMPPCNMPCCTISRPRMMDDLRLAQVVELPVGPQNSGPGSSLFPCNMPEMGSRRGVTRDGRRRSRAVPAPTALLDERLHSAGIHLTSISFQQRRDPVATPIIASQLLFCYDQLHIFAPQPW